METRTKPPLFSGIHPLLLSVLTSLTSVIFIILIAAIGSGLASAIQANQEKSDFPYLEAIPYLIGGLFIAVTCYIITRAHPRHYWYIPLVCNAMGIMAAIAYYDIHDPVPLLLAYGIGWAFSILGTAIGFLHGRQ